MVNVQGVLVSDELKTVEFVCHLAVCKGACCVEGELGAPLELQERAILDAIADDVRPYLTRSGALSLARQGNYVLDEEGDFSTPVVEGRECAYAVYGDKGVLKCGIEQAYLDGKTTFRKPISCHLYPIRVTKNKALEALNYHKWSICSAACGHGQSLKVPLYVFLKEPLIRKYGTGWYNELLRLFTEKKKSRPR